MSVNNNMISVVEITFVEESQNFDFETSGKCSQRRRRKWSWLCKDECDESDIERDENSSGENAELSCSESTSSESANSESVNSDDI